MSFVPEGGVILWTSFGIDINTVLVPSNGVRKLMQEGHLEAFSIQHS